jgi:hypothetical protein
LDAVQISNDFMDELLATGTRGELSILLIFVHRPRNFAKNPGPQKNGGSKGQNNFSYSIILIKKYGPWTRLKKSLGRVG